MHVIFVSYASKDQDLAMRVVRGLERCGLPCWISARDIKPGADYQASIVAAVEAARIVLLLLSRAANESPEVPKEMSLAGGRRTPIIPARIENVMPAGALAYQVAHAHYIDLFSGFEARMAELCDYLGEALQSSSEVSARLRQVARARAVRRWLAAAGVAIILAAGGALLLPRLPPAQAILALAGWWPPPPPASLPSPLTASATAPAVPLQTYAAPPRQMGTPPPYAAGRQAEILVLLERYYALLSGAPDAAVTFLNLGVTDPVRFYGMTMPRSRLIATEQSYFVRWPERSFTMRPDSVSITCGHPDTTCFASGIVDYVVSSVARSARSVGTEQFMLRVDSGRGGARISEMNSVPISRYDAVLPGGPKAPATPDGPVQPQRPPG